MGWKLRFLHDEETGPLRGGLENSQQASKASQSTDFLATGSISHAPWKDENISKGRGSRCCSQQDKVRRYPEGAAQGDDADVLREIGDQDSDKYQTIMNNLLLSSD